MNNTTQDSKMTAKEVYEGMTKSEFRLHRKDRNELLVSSDMGAIFSIPHEGKQVSEHEANAEAIIQAVNGTWLKGINPNAVGEMLEALKEVVGILPYSEQTHKARLLAKKAIENATLK